MDSGGAEMNSSSYLEKLVFLITAAWMQGVGKFEASLQFAILSLGTPETKGLNAETYGLLTMLLSWPTKLELNLNLRLGVWSLAVDL